MTSSDQPSTPRFYCPDLAQVNADGELSERESRHVAGARRHRVGDDIALFDGLGTVARATIMESGRRIIFRVKEREFVEPPVRRIVLATAIPKGDRQATLLDMATQLGATDVVPTVFENSVWRRKAISPRWERVVLEASKQCRRAWLPRLHEPLGVGRLKSTIGKDARVVIADARGERTELPDRRLDVIVVVGPEGGLTSAESDALRGEGAQAVSLGPYVLRIETAAIAALSVI